MTALVLLLPVILIYITSSSHFVRIYIYYYSYQRLINPLTTTLISILAKFPWLVAATIYPILCPHWLIPYQCLDKLAGTRPALTQALHLVTSVFRQPLGHYSRGKSPNMGRFFKLLLNLGNVKLSKTQE